jgi:MFS transporter, FHS family, glucose/mannose:H+ symporter
LRDLIRANAGLLTVGVLTFIVMGAGQSVYGPALPTFARRFSLSLAGAGWLISAHWIGCALGVVLTFVAGPAITPRITLAVMAAGAAGVALGPAWGITLLSAVTFGFGYGLATVVFNPRVLQAFGAKGAAMLSLLNATFGVGAIGAPLVFVAMGSDPRLTFGLVGTLCALIWFGAGAAGGTRDIAPASPTQPFRPHWPILAFGAVAIGMEACLIGLGPTALIAAGETEVHAAELLSAFFLAFLAARTILIFTAHLLPAFTLYLAAVSGAMLSALGAILIAPGPFFVVTGFFTGLFFPSYYVSATRKMGQDSRVPATIVGAGLIGGIASPVLLARFLEGAADRAFFWVIGGVALTLALTALLSHRQMNRA